MNRKLVGILGIAVVALAAGYGVWSMTWTSCMVSMTAHSASIITIGQFEDCECTIPFLSHDWNGVVQGQHYEVKYYIQNTGTEGLYITYLPTWLYFDDNQTRFEINVNIIEFGTHCQLDPVDPIVPMLEKDPLLCDRGFFLPPGKVIKIDVILYVHSLVSGGAWAWDFYIHGCAP